MNNFILAGNSSYANRGCEAIIRGTMAILRKTFADPQAVVCSNFVSKEDFDLENDNETDDAILHNQINFADKFTPEWIIQKLSGLLSPLSEHKRIWKAILPYLAQTKAVLSVGGDNYSLDYGIPKLYTGLDDLVYAAKKPLVIWAASIGPFTKNPQFEKYMIKHLRPAHLFVREKSSKDYLNGLGLKDNVYYVADPAFVMDPKKPDDQKLTFSLPENAIGINFSPLMANYISKGNISQWAKHCAKIVEAVLEQIKKPVLLIPHETRQHTNDHAFLKDVYSNIKDKENVYLIPPIFNAQEIKWIIAKTFVFAGARTHSTIAAMSSCVPTLCFSYSIKSKGINNDIFGSLEYCLNTQQIADRQTIVDRIQHLCQNNADLTDKLSACMPEIKKRAFAAGDYLKKIVEGSK
jgi:colanic acid/amylovoran biosynthesis protein